MFRLRFAILGAAAALALGSAGAMAMESAGTNDADSHGDAVASAAHNCATGPGGVHGACVSSVARSESSENDNSGSGKATAPGQVCKAADKTEPAEPTTKSAGRTEDRAEHQAFAACVQAASGGATNS